MSVRVFTIAALALLCGSRPASAEQFRYKFRPGRVQQYRISLAGATLMGASTQSVKSQFRTIVRQTQRVRSVSGHVATLEVTETPISSVTTTGDQTERTKEPPTRSLIRVTDRGRFLSRQRLGGGQDASEGTPLDAADALYGLNFPARDVKPGESWTEALTIPVQGTPRKVTVTTKYVKRETIRGRNCAKFVSNLSMPLFTGTETASFGEGVAPTGRVIGSVTTYFDPVLGEEVYATGSISMLLKADLTSVSPEAGELVTATKINIVQQLLRGKK